MCFLTFNFQLEKPAKKTKMVKCLKLGEKTTKEPAAGTSCTVAGWGITNAKDNQMSDVLMSVNVTVIDREKCNSPQYYNKKPVITCDMICAGSNGKKKADTCKVIILFSFKLMALHYHLSNVNEL